MLIGEPADVSSLKLSKEIEEILFLQSLSNLVARLSYDRRLERAWQMVERDYADSSLTLDEVATGSGANKNHLNVLIRRRTSLTFHQLLIRYRLARAVEMMLAKNYSILEIALENGFGSITTFERNFRAVIGTTPVLFRRQHNK
jgi:AraC-type DNA-binding domain-containing proteins